MAIPQLLLFNDFCFMTRQNISSADVGDAVLLVDALGDSGYHLAWSDLVASCQTLVKEGLQGIFPQHWGRNL